MMKQSTIFVGFLLISSAFASNVVKLNDSNFSEFIENTSVALVAFTTTWCGHSIKFQPEFSEAADELKIEEPTMTLINVDCDKSGHVCQKFGIRTVPTVFLFKNGTLDQKYEGNRTASAIVTYLQSHSSSNIV